MKNFTRRKEFATLLITLTVAFILSLISPAFLRLDNLLDLVKGNVVLGIMAFGMLPIIISSGIDLSVSSTIVLCSVVCGKLLTGTGLNLLGIFLISLLVGALIGFCNGIIISLLKIPPIITTLSTMGIVLGSVLFFTNGETISNMPEWFRRFGLMTLAEFPVENGQSAGIPIQIVVLLFVGMATWFLLRHTLLGRGVYAIGGREASAERVGYNVRWIQIFIYAYSGAMTGIAALINTSIIQQVDPNTFSGFELNVISAVVLGGASIMGGSGSVFGTLLGVLLLAIINNGLILAHVPTFWQGIVMGLIILLAVSVDVLGNTRAKRKLIRVDVEE